MSELTGAERLEPFDGAYDGQSSDRSIGILVHRLLQRLNFNDEASEEQLRQTAASMLDAVPAAESCDAEAVIAATVSTYRQLSSRIDVRDLYRSGRPYHEVPFTMLSGGAIVRGTIDCLIAAGDRVTVLEFKTGRPRPEHQAQAEVYQAAAEALFPGLPVQSRLVYMSGPTLE